MEPVGLGLMCDYNIIVGRGGIAGDVKASNGANVQQDGSAYAMFMMMSRRRKKSLLGRIIVKKSATLSADGM